ncbi:TIGR03086 family metal-binding protein [Nocardioides sp. MAHUQ-72]|uniref:TIGR03086 family metal-binding protein n=1 Tax=unclassified Nocardioides TaxID=2615069 RepID=UPI003610BB12
MAHATTDVVDEIARSLATTGAVVAGIGEDQWVLGTPCEGWTVRTVLNHTVGGMRIFAAELEGLPPGADHEADWLGSDPRTAFAEAAHADATAWRRPGALGGTVTLGMGTLPAPMAAVIHLTEVLVHGVDLAVATGQQHLLDEASCERLLATMHAMGGVDAYRQPGMFGPEVAAPADARPHERLLAFLGRTVSTAPATV